MLFRSLSLAILISASAFAQPLLPPEPINRIDLVKLAYVHLHGSDEGFQAGAVVPVSPDTIGPRVTLDAFRTQPQKRRAALFILTDLDFSRAVLAAHYRPE